MDKKDFKETFGRDLSEVIKECRFDNSIKKSKLIFERIDDFNSMYGVKKHNLRKIKQGQIKKRLGRFKRTLIDEVLEVRDIIKKCSEKQDIVDISTDIADWLHDIVIYCLSEARKYGFDSQAILHKIIDSNESKLDENGNAIFDKNGKVLKGPNFFPPEPEIKKILLETVFKRK